MDMAVDAGRGQDQVFPGNGVSAEPDNHILRHAIHNGRVTAFTNANNQAIFNTDVGLNDAQFGIENRDVGNHQVQNAVIAR